MKCGNLARVPTKLRTQKTSVKEKWNSRMMRRKKMPIKKLVSL